MIPLERGKVWRQLLAWPELGVALVVILMFSGAAALSRRVQEPILDPATGMVSRDASGEKITTERNVFLNPSNLQQITREASYFAIMAVGATIVLVGGGVDLSIASIFTLSAIVAARIMSATTYSGAVPISAEQEAHWIAQGVLPSASTRIFQGTLAGIATGAACGALNGILVTALKSPPFLITLGTMLIYRAIAFLMTMAASVGSLPGEFVSDFGQATFGGLNVHVPLTIAVVLLGWIYMSFSVPGRMTLAVGGNEEAARTAGLPVLRIKVLSYTIAGALGGVAALLYLASSGSIQSGDGRGWELTVIAAAVIGGASLSGGRGTAIGALLGALFLELLKNSLFTLQIPQNYEQLVIGIVIVSAAGFNRLRERLSA